MSKPIKILFIGVLLVLSGGTILADSGVTVRDLRCEYRANPLGIDVVKPRLSWIIASAQRGQIQSAYQILVAGSEESLKQNKAELWDSGKVESDRSVHVVYEGKSLKSRMRCYWKVRIWDKAGKVSAWSEPAMWTMGLLDKSEWAGQWIGAEPDIKLPSRAPMLRKEFSDTRRLKRAYAYICGLGYYELYINGKKVGNRVLEPGHTNYDKRVLYSTYDVTDHLVEGRNAIGVILGGGWYKLATPDLFGFEKAPWTDEPKLLLNIELEFTDGSSRTIATDTTWKCSTGPIIFNCLRGGETYDARMEKPGWNKAGFDDAGWQNAKPVPAPKGRLVAQQIPPIRMTKSILPVKLTEPIPGVYVFDLGVKLAGWVQLKTSGQSGQRITLRFNDGLYPNGTVDMRRNIYHTWGRFQTGEFILKGQGIEVYEPRFTYHGFRYVQVIGLSSKPKLQDLIGRQVHSDMPPAGEFACSNTKINRVHKAIVRTQLNHMHSFPAVDPTREKVGWLNDGLIVMEECIFNFDSAAFFTKWFYDMLDGQESNGHVPAIIPTSGWGQSKPDGSPGRFSDPWWGGAIVYVPWQLYRYYGDKRILQEGYEGMKKFVDYLGTTAEDYILSWQLGDWNEEGAFGHPKRTPIPQTVTTGYFYFAKIVSRTAELLDKQDEAKKYADLAEQIRNSFNRKFLNPQTGLYANDSQTSQVLPLYFGIVPDNKKELVFRRLLDNIKKRGNHLSTGFIGTMPLVYYLTESGRADLAYTIVAQEDYPGWWYMVKDGSSTVWESWDGQGSRHHMFPCCIGSWYYWALAGIRPDAAGPGFKKFIIKPEVVGDLTWVKGSYKSMHGNIISDWKRQDNQLTLNVAIPGNTTATVYVPARDVNGVTESGKPAGNAEGVEFLRMENDAAVFAVGSGRYQFISKLPN